MTKGENKAVAGNDFHVDRIGAVGNGGELLHGRSEGGYIIRTDVFKLFFGRTAEKAGNHKNSESNGDSGNNCDYRGDKIFGFF